MKIFVGLSNYDSLNEASMCELAADGYILGDLLCNGKMFQYGEDGFTSIAKDIVNCGRSIIYQTPLYVTDRNFLQVINRIAFLKTVLGSDAVLVHDVGVAYYVHNHFPDIKLIWSRFGRTRNSTANRGFIDFLHELDISAAETDIPIRIEFLNSSGIEAVAVYGNTAYNTISRECYDMYLLDNYGGTCNRECVNRNLRLESHDIKMTVDGCMLGEKLVYQNDDAFYSIVTNNAKEIHVYAKNAEDAAARIGELKRKGILII